MLASHGQVCMWQTSVEGLQGVEYLDSLQNKQRLTQNDPSVRFTGEVDRIYLQTPNRLEVCHTL